MKNLRKVDEFIAKKILARKIQPIIYLLWIATALYIRKNMIGIWPIEKFIFLIFLGLFFLTIGIRGIKTRKLIGGKTYSVGKEASIFGYIALLFAIVFLFYP